MLIDVVLVSLLVSVSYDAAYSSEIPEVAAGIGDKCKSHQDCVTSLGDGAWCNTTNCVCQPQFIYDKDKNKCLFKVGTLGDYCDPDKQKCSLGADENSRFVICFNNSCQCTSESVHSLDNTSCLARRKQNDPCKDHTECTAAMGDGATCADGKGCDCQQGFTFKDGYCSYKISTEGDECEAPSKICYVDADGDNQKLKCIDGLCQFSSATTFAAPSITSLTAALGLFFLSLRLGNWSV